jgi:hypothetical protein
MEGRRWCPATREHLYVTADLVEVGREGSADQKIKTFTEVGMLPKAAKR